MKLSAYLSAVTSAAVVTLLIADSTRAIVATNQAALENQQLVPGQFSGVVALQTYNPLSQAFDPLCTGSLLSGGQHILTAAHCLTEMGTDTLISRLLNQPFVATFNLLDGPTQIPIRELFVLPDWTGILGEGNDIAVLSLLNPAPTAATQYDIYRNNDELGQSFTKVGYGRFGVGATGAMPRTSNELLGFFGQNQFEATETVRPRLVGSNVIGDPLSQLLYDFDSGNPSTSLFGSVGLGINEVSTAQGDSGGPAFLGDRIAGITSYGVGGSNLLSSTDIDNTTNSTFGELAADTRVSTYAGFVDAVIAGDIAPTGHNQAASVPEPSTVLGGIALGFLLLKQRRPLQSK